MNRYDLLKLFAEPCFTVGEEPAADELLRCEYIERRGEELWLTASGARMLATLLEHDERSVRCRCGHLRAVHDDASPHACLDCAECRSFTPGESQQPSSESAT